MDPQQNKRAARFLLAMPDDLRHELQRAAFVANRTLTAEINMRLRASLKPPPGAGTDLYAPFPGQPALPAQEQKGPIDPMTEADRAMLAVFRALPPEKQLALLSLFR